MVYIVVGEAEVYVCTIGYLDAWLNAGYRLYGAADTTEDVQQLYSSAEADAS